MPSPAAPQRLRVLVRCDVQGVGFRYHVLDAVRGTGLAGWVRNRADGSLECLAEGPQAQLRALLAMLERGPPGARVDAVEVTWDSVRGDLRGFHISG